MTTEAMKLALEALEESKTNNDTMEFHDRKNKAITAIKEALAKQEQGEPVSKDQWWVKELEGFWGDSDYQVTLDTRRAAKTALTIIFDHPQPKQEQGEPVYLIWFEGSQKGGWIDVEKHKYDKTDEEDRWLLYTTPQQRKPLTDEMVVAA